DIPRERLWCLKALGDAFGNKAVSVLAAATHVSYGNVTHRDEAPKNEMKDALTVDACTQVPSEIRDSIASGERTWGHVLDEAFQLSHGTPLIRGRILGD